MAAIHALANNSDTYDEGFLRAFIDRVQKLAPLDRGEELGKEATIQEVSEEVCH